jgi:hypothetical protein
MLPITGVPPPPNNTKLLAWKELIEGAATLTVRMSWCSEAQGINPHMRNGSGGEMSKPCSAHKTALVTNGVAINLSNACEPPPLAFSGSTEALAQ